MPVAADDGIARRIAEGFFMDCIIARPDVFLAYYQSILAEDDGEDSRLLVSTAMALALVLAGSCLVCVIAVGLLG